MGGFDVQSKALREAAEEFDSKARAVNEKISEFSSQAKVDGDAFGLFGEARQAYTAYSEGVETIIGRLKQYRDGFQNVADGLRTSADSYEEADDASAAG